MRNIHRASLLISLVLLTACIFDTNAQSNPDEKTSAEVSNSQKQPVTEVGALARAFIVGSQWIYLAVDLDAMNDLIDVQNASDLDGLRRLGQKRVVFRIPNNTHVKVVEREGSLTKVRATEEDRVYTGREGWLQYEHVLPVGGGGVADADLPDYIILDKVGDYLDVLVPSLGVETPDSEVESVARRIADIERVGTVSLYKTKDAHRANMSASFAKANPNAMAEGYLGMLQDDEFIPSTY